MYFEDDLMMKDFYDYDISEGESECCGSKIINGLCSMCHEHTEPMEEEDE